MAITLSNLTNTIKYMLKSEVLPYPELHLVVNCLHLSVNPRFKPSDQIMRINEFFKRLLVFWLPRFHQINTLYNTVLVVLFRGLQVFSGLEYTQNILYISFITSMFCSSRVRSLCESVFHRFR